MNMDQALQTFLVESRELLEEMEARLLHFVDEAPANRQESINAIFRAAHTIKGSAGLFGIDAIVDFTHVLESVLDTVRAGALELDDSLITELLAAKDHVGLLVDCFAGDAGCPSDEDIVRGNALRVALSAYLDSSGASSTGHSTLSVQSGAFVERTPGIAVGNDNWHIVLRFGRDVLRNGMDPLSFFRYLKTIGEIVGIVSIFDALPSAAEMDPESCYMSYGIVFRSDADKATIESVFDFVREDCDINILPPHSHIADFVKSIADMEADQLRTGEILVRCGALTPRELQKILDQQKQQDVEAASGIAAKPLGELAVDNGLVQPAIVDAALRKQQARRTASQSIRVDSEKLDQLINLVGELVTVGAGVNIFALRAQQAEMLEATSILTRLIEEVRDGALNLRMVQVGEIFGRFERVVRDVSKELGKEIELELGGGETELDKVVVEKISDPLMHLVRNAIDHGIESTELRLQRGKPAKGKVRLNACHDSGSVVIEVIDDGGGLSREKILAKAIEKGLVSAGQELTDQDVHQLIFEAGFSTADQVSAISGRGVGMDVVRRNIEALRGSIAIESRPMAGTTMRIRLPLTLAIIDGFHVAVGTSSYVIPLSMVVECVDLTDGDRSALQSRRYVSLRGEVLPFVRLRDFFAIDAPPVRRESVVVVQYGQARAGLVVDALHGELQTVIKPLGKLFERMKGLGGSTVLGNGEVALILDVHGLIQQAERKDIDAAA